MLDGLYVCMYDWMYVYLYCVFKLCGEALASLSIIRLGRNRLNVSIVSNLLKVYVPNVKNLHIFIFVNV